LAFLLIFKVLLCTINCGELSALNAWGYGSEHFVFYKTS